MMFGIITSFVAFLFVLAIALKYKFKTKKKNLLGYHVMVRHQFPMKITYLLIYYNLIFKITGGSSGIGKCVAIEAAKIGANITIIARDENRLRKALENIKTQCLNHNQKFNYLSGTIMLDVFNNVCYHSRNHLILTTRHLLIK